MYMIKRETYSILSRSPRFRLPALPIASLFFFGPGFVVRLFVDFLRGVLEFEVAEGREA